MRILAAMVLLAWSLPANAGTCVLTGTIAHVRDGDTIDVLVTQWPKECGPIPIRIAGIDTPESLARNAACPREIRLGLIAKQRARALLPDGSPVVLKGMGRRDNYGRLLSGATLPDGRDFATVQLSEGMAKPYDPTKTKSFKKPEWCK